MRRIRFHPATKGALTHTSVVGIVVFLITGLHQALPEVPDWAYYLGGLALGAFGFAGLFFTINNEPPPSEDDSE
jgi:uncharacterized membrane protein YiaA